MNKEQIYEITQTLKKQNLVLIDRFKIVNKIQWLNSWESTEQKFIKENKNNKYLMEDTIIATFPILVFIDYLNTDKAIKDAQKQFKSV